MRTIPLGELAAKKVAGLDPSKTPDQEFELWSIPSFDVGKPEILKGSQIGSTKKRVEPNDVLLSRIVPHIRRSWVVSGSERYQKIASGEWIVFRDRRFVPDYLRHFLISDLFHKQFMLTVAGVGGSLLRARPDGVAKIEIPLPPLDEQRRIATILDQADALRRKRLDSLELSCALKDAVFAKFFINQSERWPIVSVDELATDIRTGPFGSQLLHSEFVEAGIAVLGIDNAVRNEFRWSQRRFITAEKYAKLRRYTVRPGDILITIMGTCGRCAIVPADIPTAINTKHLCCLTLDSSKVIPEFLHAALLTHPDALKHMGVEAKGAVMPGLNIGIVKSLKLPLPPIQLQNEFKSHLEHIDSLRNNYKYQSTHIESFFSSLQHRAFWGEL